jgi:PilZ domain-containing protein
MTHQPDKRRNSRMPVACAVYYSDGAFHASGVTENLTTSGGCLHGTHSVRVGMELMVLLIPVAQRALLIKKATVRWADEHHFGVELDEADCGAVGELDEEDFQRQQAPLSVLTH